MSGTKTQEEVYSKSFSHVARIHLLLQIFRAEILERHCQSLPSISGFAD